MTQVGIFARPPRAGLVKTRLIPDIGAAGACAVYRHCLVHTLEVVAASGLQSRLFLSEASDDQLFSGHSVSLQHGADLGERMFNAIAELLRVDADGAIIIGSDCLDLKRAHLRSAADALGKHELVLMPAYDGGYALIGCSRLDPGLFSKVSWSSEKVLEQTLANAKKLAYDIRLLETVRDIDTLQDLEQYPELIGLISPR